MIIKEGKTNIKYLLIVVILAAIVGGGILWCVMKREFPLAQLPEIKKPEKVEVEKIINKVLPVDFAKENARYFTDDLDEDGKLEIIITAVKLEDYFGREGYFSVVTILDEEGNYEKVGELEYEAAYRGIPVVIEVKDIDNDNQKEIFLSLAFGGASTVAEGILALDFANQKLDWIKFQDEDGNTNKAIFYIGASVMHQHDYTIEDLDKDGQKEIVKEDRWGEYEKPDKLEPWEKLVPMEEVEGMWWRYEVRVYEWNGLIFSYNEDLSKERLSMINWKIYMNEKYKYEVKYPKDWMAPESPKTKFASFISNEVTFGFSINIYENLENLAPKQWWKQWLEQQLEQQPEEIRRQYSYVYQGTFLISGIKATVYKGSLATFYIVPKNQKIYAISFQLIPEEMVQSILSTFRFLEQGRFEPQ